MEGHSSTPQNEFQRDREIVLAAVKTERRGRSSSPSDELHQDREIVLAAVKQDGRALQFASTGVATRGSRGVVLAAVLQDEDALQYADESLQSDQHFLREVSERRAAAQSAAIDASFTLDPIMGRSYCKRDS